MLAQIDGWKDTATQWYLWLDELRVPAWVFVAVVFVYALTMIELRYRSKRERDMGRKRLPPGVELICFKAIREASIKGDLSDKEYAQTCRYFAWLGFDKFRNPKKHVFGKKAQYMKEQAIKRLNALVDSTPAKLPE